jgi:hypothetical protein
MAGRKYRDNKNASMKTEAFLYFSKSGSSQLLYRYNLRLLLGVEHVQ